jgi:predicted SAM-dependent methyltransferase
MRQTLEPDYGVTTSVGALISQIIRYPLNVYRIVKQEWKVARRNQRKLTSLRQGGREILIELGAGTNAPPKGWTTVDLTEGCDLRLDLRKPLPFRDNEVSRIYCSHVLEHFSIGDLGKLLSECYRVLRSGGELSVAVPNSRIYVDAYQSADDFDTDKFCSYRPAFHSNGRIDLVNYMAYMDGTHFYMFDKENLLAVIRAAGFNQVSERKFDPLLDLECRAEESIYARGIK